ncbi:hypothetical protein C9I98_02440 [Photobacterium sanctipauli]|uniref:Uncharacterized protein n=2 Tax=Photobacterium sanctipauli TaxID=1342794 RepID=A0A2T3P0U4_9GAMM|nr:hypothetical protein [Photobacterium sanctipauli]PSW22144.1 hypothetical protein C9I98_02440 [Photobacterium sanctipauli]
MKKYLALALFAASMSFNATAASEDEIREGRYAQFSEQACSDVLTGNGMATVGFTAAFAAVHPVAAIVPLVTGTVSSHDFKQDCESAQHMRLQDQKEVDQYWQQTNDNIS